MQLDKDICDSLEPMYGIQNSQAPSGGVVLAPAFAPLPIDLSPSVLQYGNFGLIQIRFFMKWERKHWKSRQLYVVYQKKEQIFLCPHSLVAARAVAARMCAVQFADVTQVCAVLCYFCALR